MWQLAFGLILTLSALVGDNVPFYSNNGLIYINVLIDGQDRQFLLDTGCSDLLINEEITETELTLNSRVGELSSVTTEIKHVQLGNNIKRNIKALKTDLTSLIPNINLDGILGMSYLDGRILYIHYGEQRISFLTKKDKKTVLENANIFRYPLEMGASKMPIVSVESNGHILKFLVDSGANVHAIKHEHVEHIGEYLQLKNNRKIISISTQSESEKMPYIFTINEKGGLKNSAFDGILSLYQLGFQEIILDFRRNELILIK